VVGNFEIHTTFDNFCKKYNKRLEYVCCPVNMAIMFVVYEYNFSLKERSKSQESPQKTAGYNEQISTRICYMQMIGVAMVGTLSC